MFCISLYDSYLLVVEFNPPDAVDPVLVEPVADNEDPVAEGGTVVFSPGAVGASLPATVGAPFVAPALVGGD